jgi:hypothetical protein
MIRYTVADRMGLFAAVEHLFTPHAPEVYASYKSIADRNNVAARALLFRCL